MLRSNPPLLLVFLSLCAAACGARTDISATRDADTDTGTDVPVDLGSIPDPAPRVVDLQGGFDSTCALLNTGVVKCWGSNGTSQLGDGTTIGRAEPLAVSGISNAIGLSMAADSACAILASGGMFCWGNNTGGKLGDRTEILRSTPVEVSGLDGIASQGNIDRHTCAVVGGIVKCWGLNSLGALGDGTTTDRLAPTAVALETTALHVDVGRDHSCALLVGGAVRCWGDNVGGTGIGDGTRRGHLTPIAVPLVGPATQLDVANQHTCALVDGVPWCWGSHHVAELVGPAALILTKVVLDEPVTYLSTGNNHSCVVVASGGVRCWGRNTSGELGSGRFESRRFTPLPVAGLAGPVVKVTAASRHTCALLASGSVQCWGRGIDGSSTIFEKPTTMLGLP